MEQDLVKVVAAAIAALESAEQLGLGDSMPLDGLLRKMAKTAGMYPVPNIAVEVCCEAALQMKKEYSEKDLSRETLTELSRLAYCSNMPRLSDREGIRDFIACVVHGMAVGIIPSTEGTRLLYGAQVAQAALPSPKSHKKRNKSHQKSPGSQPLTPNSSVT